MKDLFSDLPSLKIHHKTLEDMKLLNNIMQVIDYKEIDKLKEEYEELLNNVISFNDLFLNNGWIITESVNLEMCRIAVHVCNNEGYKNGENVLLEYYTSNKNIDTIFHIIKNQSFQYFEEWINLIELAFNYHKKKEYFASVPLLLMIIDGSVSKYTKNYNFFSQQLDLSTEDSFVNKLSYIKDLYFSSRKKTNTSIIEIPYRNGILHGRDVNYGNSNVSSKLVNLILSISDWMVMKDTESERIEKISEYKSENNKTIIDHDDDIKTMFSEKKEKDSFMNTWKKENIIISNNSEPLENNDDDIHYIIPPNGQHEDYAQLPFILKLIETLSFWKDENYGNLANSIKTIIRFGNKNKKDINNPGALRKVFKKYKLINYNLLNINRNTLTLKEITVELELAQNDKVIKKSIKFRIMNETLLDGKTYNDFNKNYNNKSLWKIDSDYFQQMY